MPLSRHWGSRVGMDSDDSNQRWASGRARGISSTFASSISSFDTLTMVGDLQHFDLPTFGALRGGEIDTRYGSSGLQPEQSWFLLTWIPWAVG